MAMLKPAVFTEPFAQGGTFDTMPLTTSGTVPNQVLGYPVIFATPYSNGGIPVDRAQTNGVFNAYSKQSVWLQGGGTFTFEPTWVAANGGYDINTILFDAATGRHVISLHNTNTANFVSTPTLINNTDWSFYPRDLYCQNAAITGNTPTSQIIARENGAYTEVFMQTIFNTGTGNIYSTMSDAGNGVFKPRTIIQGIYGTANAYFGVIPNGSGNAYNGLYSSHYNTTDNDVHVALQECFPDSTGFMHATLYASNDFPTNASRSGIECIAGQRPKMMAGATSVTSGNSLTILDDFPGASSASSFNQAFPSGRLIQGGFGTVLNGNNSVTITFPVAFTEVSSIVVSINDPTAYGVSYTYTDTDVTIHIDTTAPIGGVTVSYSAMGKI